MTMVNNTELSHFLTGEHFHATEHQMKYILHLVCPEKRRIQVPHPKKAW